MAEQRFTSFERQALWEAHGRPCAYCREHLSFADLQIDHILPESLLTNSEAWELIRIEQSLPRDFSLLGYENLQPACYSCNSRKHANQFPAGKAAIELGVARKKKPVVEDTLARLQRQDKADRIRFQLASALQSGTLSESDISQVLSRERQSVGAFRLSSEFMLFGEESLRDISRNDFERYLSEKVSISSDMVGGLRLVSDDDREVRVSTLVEYESATADGFYPLSNVEMQIAFQSFERPLTLLYVLQKARVAEQSFVDDPKIGLADISLLPADLLFATEDMTDDPAFAGQKAKLKEKSIGDLVSVGEARISGIGSDSLGIDYDGNHTFMFEILRADMNGDGIQDIMVHWGAGPLTGTFRTASVIVLSRSSGAEMFSAADVNWRTMSR